MQHDLSYKYIWHVSYPIILGGVAQTVINVTDSAFLGHVSEVALGASAIAGLFYVTLMMLGYGFGVGVQIIIARLNGEGNYAKMGNVLDHSLYFLMSLSLVLFVGLYFGGPLLLSYFIKSPAILEASISFIKIRSFAIFFSSLVFVIRAFFTGIAQTKIIVYTTIIVAVFNIIFNYIFVFGHFGAPRMEIAGSALASVLAEIIAGIFAIVYMFKTIDIEKYQVFKFHAFDYSNLKDVLQIAAPVMLQMFISLSSWFIFFMIVEQMGERPLAISNLIRNAYMILMIPLIGLSSATNTLVSTLIGQKRYNHVFAMIKKVILMSFVLTLLSMLINLAFANYTFGIFTNDLGLIRASIPSLYVISGSLMLFSIAVILLSSVSGSGNTPMSLLIEIITIIFYLLATWLVGVKLHLAIEWVWSVEYVYFIFMGGLSMLYLRKAKKNNFGQINL